MHETTQTPAPRTTQRRLKLVATVAVVMAALASLTAPASARWLRGFSDVNTAGDDIAVCDDTITLEAEITHQKDSFENRFPDYVGELNVSTYPGTSTNPAQIPLYDSYIDAITMTNEIATVEIEHYDRGFDAAINSYRFDGQGTINTPSGYENGEYLYTWGYDSAQNTIVIPFEIGDPEDYDCGPSDLPWAVFSLPRANVGTVDALLPHMIIFDATNVDPRSLRISNGQDTTDRIQFLGAVGRIGFAQVWFDEFGFGCDDRKLVLSGADDTYEYERTIEIDVIGKSCVAF